MTLEKISMILEKNSAIFSQIKVFPFKVGFLVLIGNALGQLGTFTANWEKIWYHKQDQFCIEKKP